MPGLVVSIFSTIGSGTVGQGPDRDLFGAARNVPPGPGAILPGNVFTRGACLSLDAYGLITIGGVPPEGEINQGQAQMKLTWRGTEFARSIVINFTGAGTRRWELAALVTSRANGAVCEGRFSILELSGPGGANDVPNTGMAIMGLPAVGIAPGNAENLLGLKVSLSGNGANTVTLQQCLVLLHQPPDFLKCLPDLRDECEEEATMELGDINGNVPSDTFTPGGAMVGTLSATAEYVGATYYGATAFTDLGTTGNTSSATFTYEGSEAAGGATAGVRWNDSAQQGIFAFIDSSGPTLRIYEMTSGWVFVQDASTSLSLTAGNGYTLTLADNGSVVTASIIDDSGVQTCNITTSLNTGNTETLFGWVGTTASYVFNAPIVGWSPSQTGTVATPEIYPAAGTYTYAQSVYVFLSSSPGASIYYTTDGSTPTSGSTPYTGPISVTGSETIKAIGILAGWTNSAVASAAYTIVGWTMESGSIDGHTSGTFTLTGSDTGTLSASIFFAGTWKAATAYYDLGTTNNFVSVTFTYQGPEGGGGVAAGLRWDDSAQEGDFAFIDTSSTPPVIQLYETTAGWSTGTSASSSALTLTSGNSYTLTIFDNGTTVSAMLTDDVGTQGCTFTPTLSTSNTQIMFGWIGLGSNYSFNAPVTNVVAGPWTTVATPIFSPAGGTYSSTQTVTISTYTSGATIYYTTDGSTPTPLSTVYTAPISVATAQTVNAIAVLSGWTDSLVGSAYYNLACTTPTFSPGAGSYASTQTVTITSTSGSTINYTVDGTPPTGSGAFVNFTASSGAITSVTATPASGGSGYPVSTTFNLDVAGGTGGIVSATTNSSGNVTSFSATPIAGGSGYTTATWAATSANVSTISSGGTISVATSQTVNAIAALSGLSDSAVGAATYAIGLFNLSFDGATQYVDMGQPAALQITGPLSVSAWINQTDILGQSGAAAGMLSVDGYGYVLGTDNSGNPVFSMFTTGGVVTVNASGVTPYTFMHIMGTWDGTTAKLFINGVLNNSTTGSGTINVATGVDFTVGAWNVGGPGGVGNWFAGTIDAVRVWNADASSYASTIYGAGVGDASNDVLTSNLVGWWKFDEGSGSTATDSSGQGNDGTEVNGPTYTSATILG